MQKGISKKNLHRQYRDFLIFFSYHLHTVATCKNLNKIIIGCYAFWDLNEKKFILKLLRHIWTSADSCKIVIMFENFFSTLLTNNKYFAKLMICEFIKKKF
jgi:hypothetical protein